MTIHLIDFTLAGHHQFYRDTIVDVLQNAGWTAKFHLIPESELRTLELKGRFLAPQLFWHHLVRRVQPEAKDILFILYWDNVKPFWLPAGSRAWILSNPIVGIWMNTWGFRRHGQPMVLSNRYRFLYEPELRLLLLDEGVLTFLKRKISANLGFLPDFTITRTEGESNLAQEVAKFKGSRRLVLMIGRLNDIKNPKLFVETAQSADPVRWAFAAVGELNTGYLFPPNDTRLMTWPLPISSEEDYNAVVQQADVLWGLYREWEGSSNLVTKAGFFGIPVAVCDGFLLEERVSSYGLGIVIKSNEPHEVLMALDGTCGRHTMSVGRERFSREFSLDAVRQAVISLIEPLPKAGRRTIAGGAQLWSQALLQVLVNFVKKVLARRS